MKTPYDNFEQFMEYSDELFEMIGIPSPNDAGLMQAYRQLHLVDTPEYRNNYFKGMGLRGEST
jgi:hypothetical protein